MDATFVWIGSLQSLAFAMLFGLPPRWMSPGMKVHIGLFYLVAAPPANDETARIIV